MAGKFNIVHFSLHECVHYAAVVIFIAHKKP